VNGKRLKMVYLSPYNDQIAFIEYKDDTTDYCLPQAWHENIDAIRKQTVNHPRHHSKLASFAKEVGKEIGIEFTKDMIGAIF